LQADPNRIGVGGAHTAEVVNVHAKLAARGSPEVSAAPVVMVAVNAVSAARLADGVGVKVATLDATT
jgi:hypothetical protein